MSGTGAASVERTRKTTAQVIDETTQEHEKRTRDLDFKSDLPCDELYGTLMRITPCDPIR
jgi:hypothetical protein